MLFWIVDIVCFLGMGGIRLVVCFCLVLVIF